MRHHVRKAPFAVDGHGATAPVADDTTADDPKGRAKNRRAEVTFSR